MENNNIFKRDSKPKGAFFWDLIKFCLISLAIVLPFRLFVAQPFVVSGKSMYPTFDNGQYLIVDELTYRIEEPKRGDVVIFHFPNNTKEYFIKRVIALPGETVAIKNGKVTIKNENYKDGFILTEPYIENQIGDMDPIDVPQDSYFVMGDNRTASYDSRAWGTLSEDLIVGRAFVRLVPFKEAGLFPGKYQFSND